MYFAAIVIGFIGSMHCFGMCGPLAMLIHGRSNTRLLTNRLLYNTGRISTYVILGALAGAIGEVVNVGGIQNVLSIAAGLLILFALIFPRWSTRLSPPIALLVGKVKLAIGKQIGNPSPTSAYMSGVFNGFLPCGMVYMALALAVLQGSWIKGVAFMFLFGLGTLPALLAAAYMGTYLKRIIPSWKKIQTVFLVLLASLMIGRGLWVDSDHHLISKDQAVECKN